MSVGKQGHLGAGRFRCRPAPALPPKADLSARLWHTISSLLSMHRHMLAACVRPWCTYTPQRDNLILKPTAKLLTTWRKTNANRRRTRCCILLHKLESQMFYRRCTMGRTRLLKPQIYPRNMLYIGAAGGSDRIFESRNPRVKIDSRNRVLQPLRCRIS